MKTRIIECKAFYRVYYKVQWKRFLFWHYVQDVYKCDREFLTQDDARECCLRLLHKDIEKTVAEIED